MFCFSEPILYRSKICENAGIILLRVHWSISALIACWKVIFVLQNKSFEGLLAVQSVLVICGSWAL